MRLKLWSVGFLLGLAAAAAAAEPKTVTLTLAQAEEQMLAFSPAYRAKMTELEAARAKADAQASALWPRLTLEASWRYVSEVPEIALFPGRPAVAFGDHNNYSVGPMLSWNFWDSGSLYYAFRSAQAIYNAKTQEVAALERSLKLQLRTTYFQAQLASEQMRMLADSFKLVQAQYQDIRTQYRAGSSSRMDSLASHQEWLASERQLHQAQTALASVLRDLFNLTGSGADLDLSLPIIAKMEGSQPEPLKAPTVILTLDPLESSLQRFSAAGQAVLHPKLPQAQMLADLASATRAYAQALGGGHWPKVQVYAKTSLDYPNGPVLETVHQNTLGASGSLSLFEFGRISNTVTEQEKLALAGSLQSQQSLLNAGVAWQKARDQLAELEAETALDEQAVRETRELAGLVYDAYRAGRASFLEVQSSNYRALGAKIQSARTQVQKLIQYAVLDSLAENEVK